MNNVYVYRENDNTYGQLEGLKVFEVVVKKPSRVISAPVETGVMSFDNKVIDPVEITVTGEIHLVENEADSRDALDNLNAMQKSRKFAFYCVTTKEEAHKNLILENLITKNSTNRIDVVSCTINFKEALLIQSSSSKTPENDDYSNQSNNGVLNQQDAVVKSFYRAAQKLG